MTEMTKQHSPIMKAKDTFDIIKKIRGMADELTYDAPIAYTLWGPLGLISWLFALDLFKMTAAEDRIIQLKKLQKDVATIENLAQKTIAAEAILTEIKKARRSQLFYRAKFISTALGGALILIGISSAVGAGTALLGLGLATIGLGILTVGLVVQATRYLYQTCKYAAIWLQAWRKNDADLRQGASVKCLSGLAKFLPFLCIGLGLGLSILFPPLAVLTISVAAGVAFIASTANNAREIKQLAGLKPKAIKAVLPILTVALVSLEIALLFIPGLQFLVIPLAIATAAVIFAPMIYRGFKRLNIWLQDKFHAKPQASQPMMPSTHQSETRLSGAVILPMVKQPYAVVHPAVATSTSATVKQLDTVHAYHYPHADGFRSRRHRHLPPAANRTTLAIRIRRGMEKNN